MNHCRLPQSWSLEPVAVQIAARQKSSHNADGQGLIRRCKVLYRTLLTYNKGSWIVQPYFQYTNVPTNAKIGIAKGASTTGGAILVNHTFKHGFSLPVRWE